MMNNGNIVFVNSIYIYIPAMIIPGPTSQWGIFSNSIRVTQGINHVVKWFKIFVIDRSLILRRCQSHNAPIPNHSR